jgi:hypothetical protein
MRAKPESNVLSIMNRYIRLRHLSPRYRRRSDGERAIAEVLKVRYPSDAKTADPEIARRILDLFAWSVSIPEAQIEVKDRIVAAIKRAAWAAPGVTSIEDNIIIL